MTAAYDPSPDEQGAGVEFRDARRARGLSLDDCQRATRISRRYLEALEEDDYAALPAPVFARGFLRSYAQYLGVDATTLISRFPGEARPGDALPGIDVLGQPPRRREAARDARMNAYADERGYDAGALSPIPTIDTRTPGVWLGPWLIAAFVALVVVAVVVAIVTLSDDEASPGVQVTPPPGVAVGPSELEGEGEIVEQPPTILLETMPDLTLGTVSDSIPVLRRSNLPFVIVEVYDEFEPAGAVIDQVPLPDTPLDDGSAVTLVVSRGPIPTAPAPPQEPAQSDDLPSG